MNKKVQGFLALTMLASWLTGCAQEANPPLEPMTHTTDNNTLDELVDKGKAPGDPYRNRDVGNYMVTDINNASRTNQPRSAHGMAYELESLEAVKGCAVVIVGGRAYVGVRPADGYTLDQATEQAIRGKVNKMDVNQQIRGIYVTAEPQAVEFLSGYSGALEQGRPIAKYQREFKTMISQTWPNGQE